MTAEKDSQVATTAIEEARQKESTARKAQVEALARGREAQREIEAIKQREGVLNRYSYVADINLAQQALDYFDPAQLRPLLDRYRPGSDLEALRGFEWFYLRRQEKVAPTLKAAGPNLHAFPLRGLLVEHRAGPDRKGPEWVVAGCLAPNQAGELPGAGTREFFHTAEGRFSLKPTGSTSTEVEDHLTRKKVTLRNHPPKLMAVAASLDGSYLATLHQGAAEVKLWEPATGKSLDSLPTPATVAAFAPGSKSLATARAGEKGQPPEIKVWEFPSPKLLRTLSGHQDGVASLQFAPNAKLLASASGDEVVLWDLSTGKKRFSRDTKTSTVCLFSPDSSTLVTVGAQVSGPTGTNVRLWDTTTGNERSLQGKAIGMVHCVALSSSDPLLAAGGMNEPSLTVWEVTTGRKQTSLLGLKGRKVVVAFAPDGQSLSAGGEDGVVGTWSKSAYAGLTCLEDLPAAVSALTLTGKNPMLAIGAGKTVVLHDPATREPLGTLPEQTSPIRFLAGRPGGQRLYTASEDGTIKVWDVETRKEQANLAEPSTALATLVLSQDGKTLLAGWANGRIQVWDAITNEKRGQFQVGPGKLTALVLTPDGKKLLGATETAVKKWELETGKESADLPGLLGATTALALSRDGQVLASVGADRKVRLWDLDLRKERAILPTGNHAAVTLTFTPDGKTLATGGSDRTVKLWGVETGQELLTLKGHEEPVGVLLFSPDGKMLLSASSDRTVRFWLGE